MGAAIGIIGAGLQLVGGVGSSIAQNQMVAQQTAYSKVAENARQQQEQLEAQRQQRQSVRQALLARSMSLTAGVDQGAQYGSGVIGGMGEAINTGAENQQGVNSSEILGNRVFAANRSYADATQQGQFASSMFAGISSLGGAIASNSDTLGRLGQDWSANSSVSTPTPVAKVPQTNWANAYFGSSHSANNGFRQPTNAFPYINMGY